MVVDFGTLITILYAILITFARIWLLMFISIMLAIVLGILAARVKVAGAIIIPITDVLEAVPVVSFFPIVLVFLVIQIGGPVGVELAVWFLIITALIWNLILGVYEAVIHIPEQYHEVSKVFRIGMLNKLRSLYLPASFPKIVSNIMPSFASGLFYITLSEVITVGSRDFHVFGIGYIAFQFAENFNYSGIVILLIALVIAIALNYYLIINPLIARSEKYSFEFEAIEIEKERKPSNLFISSVSERVSQILSAGRETISTLRTAFPAIQRKEKRAPRIRISDRSMNIIVGAILLILVGMSMYFIAVSGFAQAFTTYFLQISFLKEMGVATLYDLFRIVLVYLFSLATMVPIAIVLGRKRKSSAYTTGIFQLLYSIPAPILFPLIVLFLTPSIASVTGYAIAYNINVLIVTFLSAAAYIFFNVYGAVLSIPSELLLVSKTFHLSKFMELRYLTFPAIIPALITGSMAAFGSYWGGLMVSEFTVIHGNEYSVGNGLMMLIMKSIYEGNLLYVEAIDLFMVIVIVIISYVLWMRLYSYSKKRYTF